MRRADVAVLLVAVALLAATSAVVKWLQVNQPLMVDETAISFCNVLFVGNLLAGLVALGSFGPRTIARDLAAASRPTRALLLLNALFAVAIPWLLFTALETTTVTNLVLLGRFESVAFALLSAWLLGTRPAAGAWAGYAVLVAGVLGLVLSQGDGRLMRGELYVMAAGVLQAVAAVVSRRTLGGCGLATFVFVRNAVSAVVFFAIAVGLYGFDHFADAFGPRLWLVMSVYSVVIVVGGQMAWYRSLERLPAAVVANVSMAAPALGIAAAWLLLAEVPTRAQWIGAAVVFAGMLLARAGAAPPRPQELGVERSLAGG